MLTLAISKGRLLDETLPLLSAVGCAPREDTARSRALIFDTQDATARLLLARAQDVPTYVACGSADAGIAGGDVVAEGADASLYRPLRLPVGACRLVVAAKSADVLRRQSRKITVATKYVNLARAYFNRRGIYANIIKLYGGLELAPLVGMADAIVDLADTGDTLRANGLTEVAVIRRFCATLICNRVAMRNNPRVLSFQNALQKAISEGGQSC